MHNIYAFLIGAAVGAGSTYWAFDPVSRLDMYQHAILAEYLGVYCGGPRFTSDDKMFAAGAAAAMSRLTRKAGIDRIALAEYAKCRIWVGG